MQVSYQQPMELTRQAVFEIPVSSIILPRFLVRRSLGDLSELQESIVSNGLLHPIVVRRTDASSQFQLVCGNRRLQVFRQLGRDRVPAVVWELDDKGSFEVFLSENIQRQTLSPLEEARAFYSYVGPKERKCFSYGKVSELAARIGKSQEYVSNRIRLLKLPEYFLADLLARKNFTASHAEELVSLADHPRELKELSDLMLENKLSVRIMERVIPLIKLGMNVKSAMELAKVESDLKLDWKYKSSPDREEKLFRKSKKVLESSLSYIDNVINILGQDSEELNEAWIQNVRLKIHDAIDGVIRCEKMYKRNKKIKTIPNEVVSLPQLKK
jgi:ParB family transcriptional regulator, chromosome partitioning protein